MVCVRSEGVFSCCVRSEGVLSCCVRSEGVLPCCGVCEVRGSVVMLWCV